MSIADRTTLDTTLDATYTLRLDELRALTLQHHVAAGRPEGQGRRSVGLVEQVVRLVVDRVVHPDPVEAHLGCFAPAAEDRQRSAAVEEARRRELRFHPLVPGDGVAAAHIEQVVGADVGHVAHAQGEAAAGVRAGKERVPVQAAGGEDVLGLVGQLFSLARHVGMQRRNLCGLLLLDDRLARRGVGFLCGSGHRDA